MSSKKVSPQTSEAAARARNKKMAVALVALFIGLTFIVLGVQLLSLYKCVGLTSETPAELDRCLDDAQRLNDIFSVLLLMFQLIVGAVVVLLIIKHKKNRSSSRVRKSESAAKPSHRSKKAKPVASDDEAGSDSPA